MNKKAQRKRSRSWILSPVIMVQIAAIMILGGVGVAFALPAPTELTSGTGFYAATADVEASAHFTVADYTLAFNDGLTQVTGVTVTLSNSDATNPHNATVTVKVLNAGGVAQVTETVPSASYAAGTTSVPVTFAGVAVENVDSISILVTEP